MIENLSNRIKAAIERRSVKAGADSSEVHEVIIEQGQEVQRPRAGLGQVEASIPFSKWVEADPQPRVIRPADMLDANPKPLAADTVVKIGNVTIAPNTVTGWEARLTRDYSAYVITLDGKIVKGDAALKALYEALREVPAAPKGKK